MDIKVKCHIKRGCQSDALHIHGRGGEIYGYVRQYQPLDQTVYISEALPEGWLLSGYLLSQRDRLRAAAVHSYAQILTLIGILTQLSEALRAVYISKISHQLRCHIIMRYADYTIYLAVLTRQVSAYILIQTITGDDGIHDKIFMLQYTDHHIILLCSLSLSHRLLTGHAVPARTLFASSHAAVSSPSDYHIDRASDLRHLAAVAAHLVYALCSRSRIQPVPADGTSMR